LYRKGTC